MKAIAIYDLLKAGKIEEAMAKLEPEVKEEVFRLYKEDSLAPKRGQPNLSYTPAKPGKAKFIDAAIFWERFEALSKKLGMKNKAAQSIGFLGSNTLPRSIRDNKSGHISTVYADVFASILGSDLIVQSNQIKSIVIAEPGEIRAINGPIFRERFYAYAKNFRTLGEAAQSLGFASSSHSPFRALMDKRTEKSASIYADHLARFLGTEILGFEKKVSTDSEGVKVSVSKTLLQQYRSEALWIDPVKTQAVFAQYAKDNGLSITGLAKKIGFQDLNALSFFMHKRTPVRTGYGHFLAKLLGDSILCDAPPPKKRTAKQEEVKSDTKPAPPVLANRVLQPEDFRTPKPTTLSLKKSVVRKPLNFQPASSTFRTQVSDFNLFEISERDLTLKTRAKDFSDVPGFEAELKGFLQANSDLFRSYPSWADAKEALAECDRRWKNRVRIAPQPELVASNSPTKK